MRKMIMVALLLVLSNMVSAAQLFLVDGGSTQYFIEDYIAEYDGNQQYKLRVVFASGSETTGMLFYNPIYQSFKVAVFENNIAYGYSIEGKWSGNGSKGFYIYNNDGLSGQTTLSLDETTNTTTTDTIAGTWNVLVRSDATDCGEGIVTETHSASATLNGNQVSVTIDGVTRSGTLNGDILSYSVSYPEYGGTTTENGQIIFSGTTNFSGSSTWSWSNGSLSCSGSSTLSGTKI